jgi:nitrate/nitrite transporter NarK
VPDALGIVLLGGAIGALSLAIVQAPAWGWGSTRILAAFGASALLAAGFLARSATHPHPVVELRLFRVRSFAVACLGVGIFALGFYALLLGNILFLTSIWGYSILTAGFAVTPGPLMAATFAALGGRLSDRFGQRVVALPGGLLFAAGTAYFATRLGTTPRYLSEFLPGTLMTGAGVGFSFAGFGSAAVAELPAPRYATGSAISQTCRQIGAVLGIATLIAVLGEHAGLGAYQRAWELMAATGGLAAAAGFALGRVRATVPVWASKSAPSTTPSPEPAPSAAPS